jgi:hypothetical protein
MSKKRKILIYIGGMLTAIWGIVHIFPLKNVVRGFGNISPDNIRIITMEWINEGFTLIFIGLLTIVITIVNKNKSKVAAVVYLLIFIMLAAMSVLSIFTGFKIDFLPYKLCPVIFMFSGFLILLGASWKEAQKSQ